MPQLEACTFGVGAGQQWPRLTRLFTALADRHCAGWGIAVRELPIPGRSMHSDAYVSNTAKLDHWARIVAEAPNGTALALLDIDALILQPLDPVWQLPFDLAYTKRRDGWPYPLNGGVVFLRVSPAVRAFMDAWASANRGMLEDPDFHRQWKRKYGGINQSALGYLLECPIPAVVGLQILALPCLEWNCEDSTWAHFDPAVTRILHVKSRLRGMTFGLQPVRPDLVPLVRLVRALDVELRGEAQPV